MKCNWPPLNNCSIDPNNSNYIKYILYKLIKHSVSTFSKSLDCLSHLWVGMCLINSRYSCSLFMTIYLRFPILRFSFLVLHIVIIYMYRKTLQMFLCLEFWYTLSKYRKRIGDCGLKPHKYNKHLRIHMKTGLEYSQW